MPEGEFDVTDDDTSEGEEDFTSGVPAASPDAAPQPPKRRRGRPSTVTAQQPQAPANGAPISTMKPWSRELEAERDALPRDLDLMLPHLLVWVQKASRQSSEVVVQVIRLVNPMASASEMKRTFLDRCRLDEVTAYGDPTEAIRLWVTEACHRVSSAGGPATYKIRFIFLDGAFIIESDAFNLDPIAMIDARRQAADRLRADQARARIAAPGAIPYTPPPSPYAAPAPQAPPAPPPAPVPLQAGGATTYDYEKDQMRQENAYLRGKLDNQEKQLAELIAAAREGRQPQIITPNTADTSGNVNVAILTTLERIVDKLNAPAAQPVVPVGVGAPAPAPVVAPVPVARGSVFEQAVSRMAESLTMTALKKVEQTFQAAMTGAAAGEQSAEGIAEVVTPEPSEPGNPFNASPVGDQTWPDGSKVYAPRTSDGEVDWSVKSIIATNPFLAVKAMDIAGKTVSNVGDALADAMRRAAAAGQAHVVSSIPSSAQPVGVGQPPPPPEGEWPGGGKEV